MLSLKLAAALATVLFSTNFVDAQCVQCARQCGVQYSPQCVVDSCGNPTYCVQPKPVLDLGTLHVSDNVVTWDGPPYSVVYVQVDGAPPAIFASGDAGSQVVTWFGRGHVYTFSLTDGSGRVLAVDGLDLR